MNETFETRAAEEKQNGAERQAGEDGGGLPVDAHGGAMLVRRLAIAEAEAREAWKETRAVSRELIASETRYARLTARAEQDRLRAAKAVARAEKEVERHAEWLASIQTSISWRVTRPLRWVKRVLRGSKRTEGTTTAEGDS